MTSRAFRSVELLEEALAEYGGSRHAVAVDSGTSAIFLSLLVSDIRLQRVRVPARTYISVPFAVIRAGGIPEFVDEEWTGQWRLSPTAVVDSALRLRRGCHALGTMTCLSFHARKRLPVGRGGAILLDSAYLAERLRRLRFDGRTGSVPFMKDRVEEVGFNAYLTPDQASRALQLLEALPDDPPDLTPEYPDLREMPVFKEASWTVSLPAY